MFRLQVETPPSARKGAGNPLLFWRRSQREVLAEDRPAAAEEEPEQATSNSIAPLEHGAHGTALEGLDSIMSRLAEQQVHFFCFPTN